MERETGKRKVDMGCNDKGFDAKDHNGTEVDGSVPSDASSVTTAPECCGTSSQACGLDSEGVSEREAVREHYSQTAKSVSCGTSCGSTAAVYDPKRLSGLPLDAIRASRGCGDPHRFADIKPGEHVLDLGSGGGMDCLLAAREVGETGEVVGLDMTDEMLELAERNRVEAGFDNVRFVKGYLEDIPLPDGCMDVVISNCVINLCSDKALVLREAARVLKDGGRFVVADMVRSLPLTVEENAIMTRFLGCGSQILTVDEYLDLLEECGLSDSQILVGNPITSEELTARAERKGTGDLLAEVSLERVSGAYAGAMVLAGKR